MLLCQNSRIYTMTVETGRDHSRPFWLQLIIFWLTYHKMSVVISYESGLAELFDKCNDN